jgi:hypothetical protein
MNKELINHQSHNRYLSTQTKISNAYIHTNISISIVQIVMRSKHDSTNLAECCNGLAQAKIIKQISIKCIELTTKDKAI